MVYLKKHLFFIGLLFVCFLLSCKEKSSSSIQISRGFYYWKTNVKVSTFEDSVMNALNSEYFYLRFFDVDLNAKNEPAPKAIINFGHTLPQQKIIPVVFITLRALKEMNRSNLDFYAQNIVDLIQKKSQEINLIPEEIQIDCDWTAGTKELYFSLLNKLKVQPFLKDKTLSVTIRLHQIKFTQSTGIPPINKGLLMVYNMDKLDDFQTENSIITEKTAKEYLRHLNSYPIPLDIALPIFSWSLKFQNKELKGILRELKKQDLENKKIFKKENNNNYKVLIDTLFKGYQLQSDDYIRYEFSNFETVKSVAGFLTKKRNTDTLKVLLYHCDSINFINYKQNELEKIFNSFH